MKDIENMAREWVQGTSGNPCEWAPAMDPSEIPERFEENDVILQDHGDRLVMVEVASVEGNRVTTIVNVLRGDRYRNEHDSFAQQVFTHTAHVLTNAARACCASGRSVRTIAFIRA